MSTGLQSLQLRDAWRVRRIPAARLGRIAVLVALTLPSITGLTATRVFAQSDEQAVIAVASHFFDGMRARDTALMRSTAVPSTMLVIPGGPTGIQVQITVDQFIGSIGKGTGPGGDERLRDPKVQIDGPMASLWSYYTYTEGGQTKIDHCGIDAFLFRKGPDGWKIFNLAGTIRKTGCTPISK
jgi:Domain of unknown function (DUF4440)